MAHLHKNFTDHQVGELVYHYLAKKVEINYIQEILGIDKTRFFALVKKYMQNPENFSIEYKRKKTTRRITKETKENIMKELES